MKNSRLTNIKPLFLIEANNRFLYINYKLF